jgi:excisionase family DNA binding protein
MLAPSKECEAQLLSAPEAARYLGVGPERVRVALRSSQMPHVALGRRLMVPRTALNKLMAEGNRITDA